MTVVAISVACFGLSCSESNDDNVEKPEVPVVTPAEEEKPSEEPVEKPEEKPLEVADVWNSGCTDKTRADSSSGLVLTKDGDVVTCELHGIVANCGVEYFDIKSDYKKGKDVPDTLFVNVIPVIPSEMDCTCPYNVTFSIRNVKADSFFLDCWRYTGIVSFKESNKISIDISTADLTVDGWRYKIYKPGQQAMLYRMPSDLQGEVRIPSSVSNEGQDYCVESINTDGIGGAGVTRLILPNTIYKTADNREFYNCFSGSFPNLESIEVEPGSRLLNSVDGVLYSHDLKTFYCLPESNNRTEYTVMEGVETIGKYAFAGCLNLKEIRLPESVKTIRPYAFIGCKNLEAVYISGKLERNSYSSYSAFVNMPLTVTLYVPESEVEYFKALYQGPVINL
jgi:hypothetical protein